MALISIGVFVVLANIIRNAFPDFFNFVEKDGFWGILLFTGIASVLGVIAITIVGDLTFGFIFSHYTDIKEYYDKIPKGSLFYTLKIIASKKAGIFVLLLFLALLLIGGGHSFVQLDLTLWHHTLAYTFGVGIPEELFKVAVGLYFANRFVVNFDSLNRLDKKTLLIYKLKTIGIIGIAGMGFGLVEAIKYFMEYERITDHDAMVNAYIIRTLWCIPLHFSWTLLAGAIITPLFFDFDTSDEGGWFLIGAFFLGCTRRRRKTPPFVKSRSSIPTPAPCR